MELMDQYNPTVQALRKKVNGLTADNRKLRRASPASVPAWTHSCNALCIDGLELWIPQCPHCGKPAPTPPVSEDKDKDKIIASLQAKIDALMLEYCPEEMTKEQMDEWARHQEPVSEDQKNAERYRFVRAKPEMLLHLSNKEFDAAIDKAMQEDKP